ncbi:hypothetical protein THRCLA_03226 [Thraustotheca clavata]|uniref:Prolyl 4-hydroxylase alpha subunit domain-containing protein n=1 Tax=Thraustotheca clavata TaxID=74557 RepID=A0A1W0A2N2_9STRA|nr:hypothetical protein THRCLA_03226 [Thraustotheca clavata]
MKSKKIQFLSRLSTDGSNLTQRKREETSPTAKEASEKEPKKDSIEKNTKLPAKLEQRKELGLKSKGTKFNLRLVFIPILIAFAVAIWKVKFQGVKLNPRKLLDSVKESIGYDQDEYARLFQPVGNKYESDIVQITTRKLLEKDASGKCAVPEFVSTELVNVDVALGKAKKLRAEGTLFLALNGRDEGVLVKWQPKDGCLYEITEAAAKVLGSEPEYFANGLRLYDGMGQAISTPEDVDAARLVYILVDFQIWVWPGIKVGYTRQAGNVTLKTISLSPLVFDVINFFTEPEANTIIKEGLNKLERSPVDSPDAKDGYHSDRTSYTAFLDDSEFTRNFRRRTATLARLPSPSFAERLQLVRYEAGQFFRKHEDYFDSKDFLGQKNMAIADYKTWTLWAADTIKSLDNAILENLPNEFFPYQDMYPNADDQVTWQHSVLSAFLDDAKETDFFASHADIEWGNWIEENVRNGAHGIIEILLENRGYMLQHIITSWEKRAKLPQLHYEIPKPPPSGVSHYFRWIRWAKERVQDLDELAPKEVQPAGSLYPTYRTDFEKKLASFILEDNTPQELSAALGEEMVDWLLNNQGEDNVIIDGARENTKVFELAVASWTKRAGDHFQYTIPAQLRHFEPNRYVTLFLYLNDVDEGGETVFPYSKERLVTDIKRDGMDECSEGLAVPPIKLHASLFYAQTPENHLDPMSLHGGCPPAKGIKFGANSFTWNADADEGSQAWGFGG